MDASEIARARGAENMDHLVEVGVKPAHLRSARRYADRTGATITEALRVMGLATSEQLARALARAAKVPYVPFTDLLANDFSSVVHFSVRNPLAGLPMKLDDGVLSVAVPHEDAELAPELMAYTLTRSVASTRALRHAYRRVFANTEKQYRDLADSIKRMEAEVSEEAEEASALGKAYPQLLVALLRHACYTSASDMQLHFIDKTGVIRLVIDGVGGTFDVVSARTAMRLYFVTIRSTGKNEEQLQKEIFGDASFSEAGLSDEVVKHELDELRNEYDFRMNFGRAKSGYTLTVRFLARDAETQEFEQLGFDEQDQKTILKALSSNSGLIVVTGPTGSGKTTTRFAMLTRIDPEERSVQTIENPVEYTHNMWMQYELRGSENEESGTEKIFLGMLRNAPRVVDVAEVRTEGAVKTMMRASATGHLVFTTLHADDAATAIYQLRTLGVSDQDLATNLQIVIANRLTRQLCPACKVPENDQLALEQARELAEEAGESFQPQEHRIFTGKVDGCPQCSDGYRGRFPLNEVLEVNSRVAQALRDGASPREIRDLAIEKGRSLRDRGWYALRDGKTSALELARVLPRRRY